MLHESDHRKLSRLRDDAENGMARAQRLLALRYLRGRGVSRDEVWAGFWMKRAADQGLALAQRGLGELLESGVGFAPDPDEAKRYYRLAAEQGDPIARRHLARLGREAPKVRREERSIGEGPPE